MGTGVYIPYKPNQALGSGVLLGLEFVEDEGLEIFGFGWSSKLTIADFLHIAQDIVLDRSKGYRTKGI